MIEINLVPDVKQELIRAQQIRSRVIISSIVFGIAVIATVALLVFYVFAVQAFRSSQADAAIRKGSDTLTSVEDLSKTLTIQNQLTKITNINDNKKISSRTFAMITSIIPPAPNDVQISTLKIDTTENLVKIDGQAKNGYAALEVFKKTIESAKVKYKQDVSDDKYKEVDLATNIGTKDVSYGQDATGKKVLRFTISFNYAPEMFSPDSKDTSVVVPASGNVTDSYLGVPNIFTDRAKDITEDK